MSSILDALSIIIGFVGGIILLGTMIETTSKGCENCDGSDYYGLWIGGILLAVASFLWIG